MGRLNQALETLTEVNYLIRLENQYFTKSVNQIVCDILWNLTSDILSISFVHKSWNSEKVVTTVHLLSVKKKTAHCSEMNAN